VGSAHQSFAENCKRPSSSTISSANARWREHAAASAASWKHVNLYGTYTFLDIGDGVDLQGLVNLLEAARGGCAAAPD
jgi:hypothetical protein